jgi:hypothetical protein
VVSFYFKHGEQLEQNDKMADERWMAKYLEKIGSDKIEVLSLNFPEGSEESHEEHQ